MQTNSSFHSKDSACTSGISLTSVEDVSISGKDGRKCKLGVSSVLERIAQQVVRAHREKQVELHFHGSSFGYRPGRSSHGALR